MVPRKQLTNGGRHIWPRGLLMLGKYGSALKLTTFDAEIKMDDGQILLDAVVSTQKCIWKLWNKLVCSAGFQVTNEKLKRKSVCWTTWLPLPTCLGGSFNGVPYYTLVKCYFQQFISWSVWLEATVSFCCLSTVMQMRELIIQCFVYQTGWISCTTFSWTQPWNASESHHFVPCSPVFI